jgi:hypothetical protein
VLGMLGMLGMFLSLRGEKSFFGWWGKKVILASALGNIPCIPCIPSTGNGREGKSMPPAWRFAPPALRQRGGSRAA